MILAETCPSCSYLITWFVGLLLKITLKGLLVDWKCLWSMFVIWFLNITRKSRNFHAFTQAYLAHAQTNFPAANILSFFFFFFLKSTTVRQLPSNKILYYAATSNRTNLLSCSIVLLIDLWLSLLRFMCPQIQNSTKKVKMNKLISKLTIMHYYIVLPCTWMVLPYTQIKLQYAV